MANLDVPKNVAVVLENSGVPINRRNPALSEVYSRESKLPLLACALNRGNRFEVEVMNDLSCEFFALK